MLKVALVIIDVPPEGAVNQLAVAPALGVLAKLATVALAQRVCVASLIFLTVTATRSTLSQFETVCEA